MKQFLLYTFILIFISCETNDKSTRNIPDKEKISQNSSQLVIKKSKGLLKCLNKKVEYGNLNRGNIIYQDFYFTNVGLEVVDIVAYESSCNCTNLQVEKLKVKPKDSTKITMVIETHDKTLGNHNVTTTIKTNGQRQFYLLSTTFNLIE